MTRTKAPVSAVNVAALAVAGVALGLCVVMAVHSVGGMGLVGCAAGSVCDDVMSGRWSRVLGIVPVSGLAAGVYLALIVNLLCVRFSKDEELVGLAVKLLPVFAGVIVGSAVWFIGLMLVEEDGVCRYCLAAHSLGLLEAVLLMVLVGSGRRCGKEGEGGLKIGEGAENCGMGESGEDLVEGKRNLRGEVASEIGCEIGCEGGCEGSREAGSGEEIIGERKKCNIAEYKCNFAEDKWDFARGKRGIVDKRGFGGKRGIMGKWGMFGAGVMLAAVLAVVQVVTAPSFVYQAGSVEEPLPLVGAAGAPVIGDAARAEVVIDILFDYQCSHCQKVHSLLPEVVSRLNGRVAFVLCPCPLSAKCNPYVPREDVRFEGSCELAKIGLAVFEIDPEAFAKYDAWMFEAGEDGWWPRGAGEARVFAEGLVGAGRLAEAMESQWIYERLLQTYELFGRTSAGGQGGIPRFICGEQWVVPEAASAEELVELLSAEFGIL